MAALEVVLINGLPQAFYVDTNGDVVSTLHLERRLGLVQRHLGRKHAQGRTLGMATLARVALGIFDRVLER